MLPKISHNAHATTPGVIEIAVCSFDTEQVALASAEAAVRSVFRGPFSASAPKPPHVDGRTWAVKTRSGWLADGGTRSHTVHDKSVATRFATLEAAREAARRTPDAKVVALVFRRRAKA